MEEEEDKDRGVVVARRSVWLLIARRTVNVNLLLFDFDGVGENGYRVSRRDDSTI